MTKVLVIEDEDLLRESILNILIDRGFSAIGAEDGRRGLQLAKDWLPDLILCDVRMPEVDGYEVLKALREDPLMVTIRFIFITAEAIQTVWHQEQVLGADGYLNKPFTTAELLKLLSAYS